MDSEQISHFISVSEHGNFTRAAKELFISQPALSRSIQRLEEELGQPLFERKPRSVELTDAGETFLERATQILALVKESKAEICDDGQRGRIRVAAIPTIAPYFLPELLRRFSTLRPLATLAVYESTTDELIKKLQVGDLDIGILALPIDHRELEVEELFDEELFLVLPIHHPLADQPVISPDLLEPHPFVLLDEAHCLSDNVKSYCRRNSTHPVAVERVNQLVMVQELVSLGQGVSMIPAMARRLDLSETRVYRTIENPTPKRTVVAAWNPYRYDSRLMKEFRETLNEYASEFM